MPQRRLPFRLARVLFVLLLAPGVPVAAQLPVARTNGNRVPAGRDSAGVRVLQLAVTRVIWHLDGEDDPGIELLAFAEPGRPAQVPGPLLRVAQGTPILARVTNPLPAETLVVFGLAARAQVRTDSLVVPPGATIETAFPADSAGTFLYWATTTHKPLQKRVGVDAQLNGAFIVDPPGPVPPDRILVISLYGDSTLPNGFPTREFLAINGKAWPHTERMQYALGDSIRWRVINASFGPHPMHLHGAYFRVESLGDWTRDTVQTADDPQMAVTQRLRFGQTMRVTWSPPHPGTWLFHCHLTYHVQPHDALVLTAAAAPHHEDPDQHVEQGMGGLMLATTVTAPDGYRVDDRVRRHLRLFVLSDSAAGAPRRYSYVLDRGHAPRPDSVQAPGPTLVLRRGEPTAIEVVNRSGAPTAVHWHGIELDSYYDGVVGLGGLPAQHPKAIHDGESFVARMTPPRAGTFMYHTHLDDVEQQAGGLYGPLVVLEPGERWDPTHDIVLMASTASTQDTVLLGGSSAPPPLELRLGDSYRLRFCNITLAQPHVTFELLDGETPLAWQVLAKDGWTWTAAQQQPRAGRQLVSIGQTVDVRFTPARRGEFTLRLSDGVSNTTMLTRKVIVR